MALDRDGRLAAYRGVRIKASSANLAPARLNRFSGSEQRGSFNNRGGPPASTPSVPQSPPPETTNRERPDARRTGQPSAEQPAGRDDDEKSVTRAPGSDAMKADRAVQTRKEEDMRHPPRVWIDPNFEQESLEKLRQEFKRKNVMGYGARGRKLSMSSVDKYDFCLLDFIRSLERHGIEPVLGALTPDHVAVWQDDQEGRGNSAHGIASRVVALKVFSNKFIFKILELTTVDLLRKVERPSPKLIEPEVLSPQELAMLLDVYDRETFEDMRDRAFVAVLAATGLRYNAVLTIRMQDYDRVTGEFKVKEKGDEDRPAQVDGRARRYLNQYLGRRPRTAATDQLWVTEVGGALSYWGGQMILRRARKRTGIARLHAHLFRHGIAHRAADQGAHPGEIQLLLGHTSTAMARRYTGSAAKRQGARLMPHYSPI